MKINLLDLSWRNKFFSQWLNIVDLQRIKTILVSFSLINSRLNIFVIDPFSLLFGPTK